MGWAFGIALVCQEGVVGWGSRFSVPNHPSCCLQIYSEFYSLAEKVLKFILNGAEECSAKEMCRAEGRESQASAELMTTICLQLDQLQEKECQGQTLWAADYLLAGQEMKRVAQLCRVNLNEHERGLDDSERPVAFFQLQMEAAYGFATGQKMFEVTADDDKKRRISLSRRGRRLQITTSGFGSLVVVNLLRSILGHRNCLEDHGGVVYEFFYSAPLGHQGDAPPERTLTVRILEGVQYQCILLGPRVVLAPSGDDAAEVQVTKTDAFSKLPSVYWAGKKETNGGGNARWGFARVNRGENPKEIGVLEIRRGGCSWRSGPRQARR